MVSPRNIRLALAILVVSATIGIVAVIYRQGPTTAPPKPAPRQLPLNIDLALNEARFTEMRGETTVWTIVAGRADYSKKSEVVQLSGIHMEFPKHGAAGTIRVTAERGTYSTGNKNVALRGKVHVTTEKGIVFDTESLDYQSGPGRFTTAEEVRFRQNRMRLMARGMDLDIDRQVALFHSAVQAVVERPKRKKA